MPWMGVRRKCFSGDLVEHLEGEKWSEGGADVGAWEYERDGGGMGLSCGI